MSRSFVCIPAAPAGAGRSDLVYAEPSSRGRGLHVLMQDASAFASGARTRFLQAAYRDVIARHHTAARIATPAAFLRDTVLSLDALARGVDTRLDDIRELGVFVLLRDRDHLHLLCTRGASARVRERGVFVPLSAAGLDGVSELSIETARAQPDLFARTLPDSLVLYRIDRAPGRDERELLLGGAADDVAAAVEAIDLRGLPGGDSLPVERLRNAVMYVAAGLAAPRREASAHAAGEQAGRGGRTGGARRGLLVGAGVAAGAAMVALLAAQPWRSAGRDDVRERRASVEHAPARETRDAPPPAASPAETEARTAEPVPAPEEKRGFELAWEKEYRGAVTSSPALIDRAVVFGARDGRVYAVDRASGERVWSYAASGGVGASPVLRGDAVVVADYGGNVVRLGRADGAVAWKRALREKIVSTPAVTRERVVAGTVRGNVAAISLDTGRVLWKFAARGQVRGGIVHAGESFLVPSHDGRLYALAEDTGARRWSAALGGPVASTPASDGDVVVVGTSRGEVVALDLATGKRRWALRTGGAVNSALALDGGRVFAGSGDSFLYCIDARTGQTAWRFDTGGAILSRPFVGDGRVVVTSYDGAVYCLDAASGELIDRYATGESIYSSPLVVDGRVFFGNNDGRFYCLEAPRS